MWGTLGLAIAAKLDRTAGASQPAAPAPKPEPPYGSGHFGRWTEDEFGLPAFEYTCNQNTDPRAATAIKAGILSPTEHVHQVGNDRIVAIASNYGPVQVRQDEGAPKISTPSPPNSQFGGGIGYLTDGTETLSTYYPGSHPHFERIFGAGYFRKNVSRQALLHRPGHLQRLSATTPCCSRK